MPVHPHFHPAGTGMFTHVRQGFLHHVQHLDLYVGRQWQAMPGHGQRGAHTRLVLKFRQRGLQRRLDVFFAGAGAKVHQQFAHIGITLTHPYIEFPHAAVARQGVVTRHSVAQQLGLNLEKSQGLCDGVV